MSYYLHWTDEETATQKLTWYNELSSKVKIQSQVQRLQDAGCLVGFPQNKAVPPTTNVPLSFCVVELRTRHWSHQNTPICPPEFPSESQLHPHSSRAPWQSAVPSWWTAGLGRSIQYLLRSEWRATGGTGGSQAQHDKKNRFCVAYSGFSN